MKYYPLLILLIVILILSLFLPFFLALVAESQNFCLNLIPPLTKHSPIYQALLCGKSLSYQAPLRVALQNLGLIHLFVVSGAHLVFIEKWLLVKKKHLLPTLLLLSLYATLTGFAPPVARALTSTVLHKLQYQLRLNWAVQHTLLLSVLILLCLFPHWANSYSLLLSSLCCLSLSLGQKLKPLKLQLLLLTFSSPILLQLSGIPLLAVISNIVLAPLIMSLLFPISWLIFIPYLSELPQYLWNLSLHLFNWLNNYSLLITASIKISRWELWLYLIGSLLIVDWIKWRKTNATR